jgi:hypothetical protein
MRSPVMKVEVSRRAPRRWKIAGAVLVVGVAWAVAQLLDSRAMDRLAAERFAERIVAPQPLSLDVPVLELSRVTPKEIWVFADSEPAGATVFADAVRIGRTPSLTNLLCQPGGNVIFRIEHHDYQPWTHTVRCDRDMLRLRPALVRKGTDATPSLLGSVTPIEGWVTRVPVWDRTSLPRDAAQPSATSMSASAEASPLAPSGVTSSGRPFGIITSDDHLREVNEAIDCLTNDPKPCQLLQQTR